MKNEPGYQIDPEARNVVSERDPGSDQITGLDLGGLDLGAGLDLGDGENVLTSAP